MPNILYETINQVRFEGEATAYNVAKIPPKNAAPRVLSSDGNTTADMVGSSQLAKSRDPGWLGESGLEAERYFLCAIVLHWHDRPLLMSLKTDQGRVFNATGAQSWNGH